MEYTPKRFHCPACGFEPAENVSEKEYAHCPPSMKRTARATNAAASYSPFPFG